MEWTEDAQRAVDLAEEARRAWRRHLSRVNSPGAYPLPKSRQLSSVAIVARHFNSALSRMARLRHSARVGTR